MGMLGLGLWGIRILGAKIFGGIHQDVSGTQTFPTRALTFGSQGCLGCIFSCLWSSTQVGRGTMVYCAAGIWAGGLGGLPGVEMGDDLEEVPEEETHLPHEYCWHSLIFCSQHCCSHTAFGGSRDGRWRVQLWDPDQHPCAGRHRAKARAQIFCLLV